MPAKKFKFRLDPLLKIREHREKERQKEHADVMVRVNQQSSRLNGIDDRRLETMDYQRRRLVGKLSIPEALASSRFMVKLKRERMEGVAFLHALQKEGEEKRRALVKAARDRKIFERLKEKQATQHREDSDKSEQKELDEVALTSFRRRRSMSGE